MLSQLIKKSLTVFVIAVIIPFAVKSQIGCGDQLIESIQKANTPQFDQKVKQMNINLRNYIQDNFSGNNGAKVSSGNYVIPVVFHVVHPSGQAYGTGANISYAQIVSQLNALNAAYGKTYPTYNGQTHPAYAQNTTIQFCLAKIAAPAAPGFYVGGTGIEYGVMRYADNTLTNHQASVSGATALAALTHPTSTNFPFTNYLNIWIVSSINGSTSGTIMGYAPKPLMGIYPIDGIVMRADIIGDNSTGNSFALGFNLQQGKVLAHEAGHYLNLYHIFEGGCAGANASGATTDACDLNGDMICDIEPSTTQNYSCANPIPNTCSATYATGTTNMDMVESYMSYADDDCMNTFTNNQTQRMQATLNTMRANLWSTGNLAATGVIGAGGCLAPLLLSTIKATPGAVCTGSTVVVSNPLSGNTASSWTWTLPGANITSATTSSVSITYTASGLYWAKLTVSNGTTTAKDSLQIPVTNCTLDSTKLGQANWYFGKNASLNFNSGSPVAQNPSMINSDEQTAAVSDSLGNLLFYTDGDYVWNKNHVQMSNLGGLLRGFNQIAKSAAQGALIVPFPFNKKKFYIFSGTQQPVNVGDSSKRLVYSVIDMSLNGGLGEISTINQIMPGPYFLSTEGLTAIPHCNGYDYWVVIRTAKTSGYQDKLAAYLVTVAGITPPVMSNAGYIVPTAANDGNEYLSYIEASPDCKLVAISCNITTGSNKKMYLYRFNNTNGSFTYLSNFVGGSGGLVGFVLGQQFSPDSKLLYFNTDMSIYQANLTTPTSPTVTNIGAQSFSWGGMEFQTGPDNKIYVSEWGQAKLGVVSFPNNVGTACSFSLNMVNLIAGQQSRVALPNMIDANKPKGISFSFISTPVNCTTNKFTVDSCWKYYNVNWNFGDGTTGIGLNINHTYTTTGTFSVNMVLSIGSYSFSPVSQNVTILPGTTTISGPSVVCKGSTFLNAYSVPNVSGATYTWTASNSSISGMTNLPSANVLTSGSGIATLSVQVINGGCVSVGTKTITIDSVPNVSFVGLPLTVCMGSNVNLNGNPAGGVFTGTGVTGTIFNPTTAGIGAHNLYYTYTNANGCSKMATSTVSVTAPCSGINELGASVDFIKIYPNPNSGEFEIRGTQETVLSVTNELGQILETIKLNAANNYNYRIVNLQSGVYFIGNNYKQQKVVVIK